MLKIILMLFASVLPLLNASAYERVAIIDAGPIDKLQFDAYLCQDPIVLQETQENKLHGQYVTELVIENIKPDKSNFCIIFIAYYLEASKHNGAKLIEAINKAVELKATIVSYSGGGDWFNDKEFEAIKKGKDTLFIVAAGNDKTYANYYYPACYDLPNIVSVAMFATPRICADFAARDSYKTMSGSSMATPRITNLILRQRLGL